MNLSDEDFEELYRDDIEDETLEIEDDIELQSISFVNKLPVSKLILSQCCGGITLQRTASNITNLTIYQCELSSINWIKQMMQLRELDLSVNNISDISELSYLTALKKLDLDANRITDISALSKLVKLQVLSVFGNQIRDIQYISNLVNLEILNISNNQIIDISALRNIKQLRELFMQNNQVVHIESLINLNLQYLDLSHNFIFDLKSIAHKHGYLKMSQKAPTPVQTLFSNKLKSIFKLNYDIYTIQKHSHKYHQQTVNKINGVKSELQKAVKCHTELSQALMILTQTEDRSFLQ
ncbi:leucine-rich_repeat domain-containing protein [Hexamita inflata]|uniref:Leucine-rich repeat domain-containing protein n=1 Tax=Hexamita inflata TaxID=28002 RepID=A0AA86NDD5_9EUKA|nr:leucine-rich repeat domain-containing protein [Hexamita inflata]